MAEGIYGIPYMFIISALSGIFLIVLISVLLQKYIRNIAWLSFVVQNILCIFAVQKPIISGIGIVFDHYITLPSFFALLITTILVSVISCGICLVVNKYVLVLAGK